MYAEEDYLSLSGVQHYEFCKRQWALIHIEQQWAENVRTVEGKHIHRRADTIQKTESRTGVLISRSMPVFSREMGTRGICDVVEFHPCEEGINLHGKTGRFKVIPIEYKRGKPKESNADVLQLCAQALCLEEMLCCEIKSGYLFYDTVKRRTEILLDEGLRRMTKERFAQMHAMYERRHTPKAIRTKSCNACSLKDICQPSLGKMRSVASYIDGAIKGVENEKTT